MYIVVRYIAIALLDLSLNGRSFAFHLANIDPKKLDGGTFTRETAAFSFFLFSAPAATWVTQEEELILHTTRVHTTPYC